MLLKKKNIITFIVLLLIGSIVIISCSKDNSPVTDDTTNPPDPIDDGNPVGFQGEIDWVKTFGGSNIDQAVAIVKSNDNAYVVVGTTSSIDGDIIDKNTTDSDYWILKISETGVLLWNRTFGGSNDDVATNISKTSDGGYIVSGYSRSNDGDVTGNEGFWDYWILKLNANGNKVWNKTFGFLGEDRAWDVFQTKDGGYFVTGFFDVTASGGAGNDGRIGGNRHGVGEYWAIKMDASGEYIWRRYFGGTNNDRSYDALETSDGGFLLVGSSESDDFDITDSKGSYDYWVVKVDAFGTKLWTKSYGGSEIDNGYAVTATADGNFIFVGDSRSADQDVTNPIGNADLWAVKFSGGGGIIWNRSFGGSQFDTARSIVSITNGNYLLAGATRSTDGDVSSNNGENDAWVVIMDANGTLVFEKTIGGSNFDFGEDAILGHDDSTVLLVGNTESNDKDIPRFQGIKDLLIVKLK
ncbi:MAG: hypothetical protein DRI70_00700 [Bacteroidetes bacterium]|nr:MAG: hypothetical protein DRI70_00700 [Bacteroidota bacterium]